MTEDLFCPFEEASFLSLQLSYIHLQLRKMKQTFQKNLHHIPSSFLSYLTGFKPAQSPDSDQCSKAGVQTIQYMDGQ